jgi:sulfur-oxidizing protein SoxY
MATNEGHTRRAVLTAALAQGASLAGAALASPLDAAGEEAADLVRQVTGRRPSESDRVRLTMPRTFPNGSAVPLTLEVDSPMTEHDHVRHVHLLAPRNPIVETGSFHFTPRHGVARVSTRIRLSGPQHVVAVAEMSDGALLMTRAWVEVGTDGCT